MSESTGIHLASITNEITGRSLRSLLEKLTPQFEKNFFKYGEMTPRYLPTLAGSQLLMLMSCLAANSVSMLKALK